MSGTELLLHLHDFMAGIRTTLSLLLPLPLPLRLELRTIKLKDVCMSSY